jgi:uncharacterized protein YceH (UPF0502 family)
VRGVLSVVEGRVLGCLLEKERTTPDQYPLTLNALVLACNQSTNREPLMNVEPSEVDAAITSMKAAGFARVVHPSHGRSVTRYRHVADERYGWTPDQAALMAVLLVRGPQTISELKTRSERLHGFASLDEVEATMRSLASTEEPFAVQLDRLPGQKEPRWQQLLAEEPEREVARDKIASHGSGELHARIAELEARVERLEAALADLLS